MLEIRILGPLEVWRDGRSVPLGSPTQRLVVTVLAAAGGVVSRDQLIDAVWGDEPPATAETTIVAHLSRLRSVVGRERVERHAPGYVLHTEWCDADVFETLVDQATADEPNRAASRLTEALALWRGPALGEFADHPSLTFAGQRLEQARTEARERLGAVLLDIGDVTGAVEVLEELVADEPWRDRAWSHLLSGLLGAGRTGDARRAAQRGHELYRNAGLDPPDFLADDSVKPPDSPSATSPPRSERAPGNVPVATDTFIGRQRELDQIDEAWGRHRLVTLAGPAGVGKSRLAIEALRRLSPAPADGRWRCDLAPVDRPDAVLPTIARTFGLAPTGEFADQLLDSLGGRSVALLLDNCEHVVDRAAHLVAELLQRAPAVKILVTSREPLSVVGEQVLDVPPLDAPTDGAALFVDRATAAGAAISREDQRIVTELCRHLDGLPLAIEMAAAQARMMSVRDLTTHVTRRLELRSAASDVASRHQTLREAIAWSFSRLSASERHVFERVSVFSGTFSLDAATAVAGRPPLTSDEVPHLLGRLVEQSLLTVTPVDGRTRFTMLGTIAEYAAEQRARREPTEESKGRKITHFSALAAAIGHGLRGPEEGRWAAVADQEMHNLRTAALDAATSDRADEALTIPAELYLLVLERLRSDVAAWSHTVLQRFGDEPHPLVPVVRAVVALGALHAGDTTAAEALARRAIDESGGSHAARFGHHVLCELAFVNGAYADGVAHAGAAIFLADAAGDHYLAAHARGDVCLLRTYQGMDARSSGVSELRHAARAVGAPSLHAFADFVEGESLLDSHPDHAIGLLDRAAATASAAGSAFLDGAARLSAATGRARHGLPVDAVERFAPLIRHWYDRGDWTHQWPTMRNLVHVLTALEADDDAAIVLGGVEALDGQGSGDEAKRLSDARAQLENRLGPVSRTLHDTGAAMTPERLVAFALASTQRATQAHPGDGRRSSGSR